MSTPDLPPASSPPPPPDSAPSVAPVGYAVPGYAPVPPRPRGSASGWVSLLGAVVLTALYFVVKVIAAVLNSDPGAFDGSSPAAGVATAFGVLGLLALVPVGVVIAFGHLGVRVRPDGSNAGRIVAAVGLGAGYVHLVAWFVRLVVAGTVAATSGDVSSFVSNIFWWA